MNKQKEGKIILDLCGGTGSWSKPWEDNGYDVRLITLPEQDVKTYKLPNEQIYGILAAPPCIMFSIARTTAKLPRDLNGAMEVVSACLKLIWSARANNGLKFWALENPRGLLRQFLGNPAMTFQQWQYGDGISKYTDLWGYFNKPTPKVRQKPTILNSHLAGKWQSPTAPEEYKHLNLDRAGIRSITPTGFANAFYQANKPKGASNSSQG